jgi:ribosomal protein S18 acetylase RimI-like enzyme
VIDTTAVALRPATDRDAERIAALLTDEGFPAGGTDIVKRLARFRSPSSVLLAESSGEVLGFIAFQVIPRFEHDDWIVRILTLVVDPGVRERGVGRMLIAEAESIGRDNGASHAAVTAGHHRPEARRLFEALGYDSTVTTYLRKRF